MKIVIEGVLENALPWGLVGIGVVIAIVAELFKIPSLPFAVGVYLPVATMMTVFLGGLLRYIMEKTSKSEEEKERRRENGILLGSGFVGGEGLLGVAIAGVAFYYGRAPRGIGDEWAGSFAPILGLAAFGLLAYIFINRIKSTK
jgi:uncharacterized oligopeptide transporter (OPT) family protein